MSFLHSAFIENTQEAREWLESIGYKKYTYSGSTDNGEYICTHNHSYSLSEYKGIFTEVSKRDLEASLYLSSVYKKHIDKTVDCRGNFSLFKSITALRDDSGYMQWFWRETLDENDKYVTQWILNDDNCKYDINESDGGVYQRYIWSRATLEELIEHFKTETI